MSNYVNYDKIFIAVTILIPGGSFEYSFFAFVSNFRHSWKQLIHFQLSTWKLKRGDYSDFKQADDNFIYCLALFIFDDCRFLLPSFPFLAVKSKIVRQTLLFYAVFLRTWIYGFRCPCGKDS